MNRDSKTTGRKDSRDKPIPVATEERADLLLSPERYRVIFNNSQLGIVSTDLDGNFIEANPAFCRMLGYSHDDLVRQNIADLTHPDDLASNLENRRQVIDGDMENEIFEKRYIHNNGSIVWVRLVGSPITDKKGDIVALFAMVEDITARKKSETELQRMHAEVAESEEKVRQAQRLESLGQLTGGVAHDFNNLLTVMLGNAELLAMELESDARLRELAKSIVHSALQGADLTHRLLAFARRQALEPRNISLNQLVDNMGKILERTLGETIRLRLYPDRDLRLCRVDPNQMESAILNLAINARDAMPRGGELFIETSNVQFDEALADKGYELQPGRYVCLSISDNGHGISAQDLERVFEPFFTTKEKGKGSGLGLSTIFGFIKQSRGHMTLYSEPGHGTTVRIYLPCSNSEEEDQLRNDAVDLPVQGNEKILLVEDDPSVRQYAETQLASLGYRIVSAGNGRQALELLELHQDIDLLFTDVIMPGGMDGTQLAEAAVRSRPGLKVLYTSGYTEHHAFYEGRLGEHAHLLSKPYQRNQLAAKLREILDFKPA